jgi:anti-sigma28 factor (negative regulator of flagellin synthesis)
MSMTVQDTFRPAQDPAEMGRRHEESRTTCATDRDQRNVGAAAERVGLLSRACGISRAREVVQAVPEVRAAKVEAARRAVHRGHLTLQGQALAEKLLQDLLLR